MIYRPDFDTECYLCGTSPVVVVEGHTVPNTQLCGPHFFKNEEMYDWEEWNTQPDEE